jgi:hypothetical protein
MKALPSTARPAIIATRVISRAAFCQMIIVRGSGGTGSQRTKRVRFPYLDFDCVSPSEAGRMKDGVPIVRAIEPECVRYVAACGEEIYLVRGHL